MEDNTIVLAHSVSSGYLENRSTLQLVRASDENRLEFESLVTLSLSQVGEIN